MKIQCEVCVNEAAAVLCTADEAALCQNCDNRVHSANKLASKHPRFSLVNPQFKEPLRCDICQERQALLFCQEDRALMCRECDIAIHRANEHTKKHNRFLLTGIKLSAAAAVELVCQNKRNPSHIGRWKQREDSYFLYKRDLMFVFKCTNQMHYNLCI